MPSIGDIANDIEARLDDIKSNTSRLVTTQIQLSAS
jgi:hypothetical protein